MLVTLVRMNDTIIYLTVHHGPDKFFVVDVSLRVLMTDEKLLDFFVREFLAW